MADVKMTEIDIKADLREFIQTNFLFNDSGIAFNDDDSFLEKRIIDSTGILELIEYLEETYHIQIADYELLPENLDSLNKVNTFLLKKFRGSSSDQGADEKDENNG